MAGISDGLHSVAENSHYNGTHVYNLLSDWGLWRRSDKSPVGLEGHAPYKDSPEKVVFEKRSGGILRAVGKINFLKG